jgi:hypothetical protein
MSFHKSLSDTTDIIKYVTNNSLFDVKDFITNKCYTTLELNGMLDVYGNNLLHIATLNSNVDMVDYLLNKYISYTKLNKFKQSPWDIAVMIRDEKILDKFTKFRARDSIFVAEIRDEFNAKLSALNKTNVMLKENNTYLHNRVNALSTSLTTSDSKLVSTQKALEETNAEFRQLSSKNEALFQEATFVSHENNRLRSDNKRLRDENDDLIDKNKKLKTSVDTLMRASKK